MAVGLGCPSRWLESWSQSVCHPVSPAKPAEAIEMPFASTTLVGPDKRLLHIADRFGRILYCVHSTQYSLLVRYRFVCENFDSHCPHTAALSIDITRCLRYLSILTKLKKLCFTDLLPETLALAFRLLCQELKELNKQCYDSAWN